MKVIGISGFAQSGKTTAANYIEKVYGYRRKHIATTMRSMLSVLLRDLGYSDEDVFDILEGSRKDGWIIPELGKTSRDLQITIGTEWGRELVCDDIWVKTWIAGIQLGEKVMNDSVRFPNEEAAIKEVGGFTVLIERPGTGPAKFIDYTIENEYRETGQIIWYGVHPSERLDLLSPTYRIVNDGSIGDLYTQIDWMMIQQGWQNEKCEFAA